MRPVCRFRWRFISDRMLKHLAAHVTLVQIRRGVHAFVHLEVFVIVKVPAAHATNHTLVLVNHFVQLETSQGGPSSEGALEPSVVMPSSSISLLGE